MYLMLDSVRTSLFNVLNEVVLSFTSMNEEDKSFVRSGNENGINKICIEGIHKMYQLRCALILLSLMIIT